MLSRRHIGLNIRILELFQRLCNLSESGDGIPSFPLEVNTVFDLSGIVFGCHPSIPNLLQSQIIGEFDFRTCLVYFFSFFSHLA